jgi:ribonuclease D
VLKVRLPKIERLTDWAQRPLRRKQIDYALEDVRHLLPLHEKLAARLAELDRQSWAQAEFADLQTDNLYRIVPEEVYRRVKGAGTLQPRQLAVLRNLAAWRERKARQRDRPVRSIMADYLLLELARRQPKDARQILSIRGIPRRAATGYAEELLGAVAKAVELADEELPEPLSRRVPSIDCKVAVDLAAAMVTYLAHAHHVATDLLATRGELEAYFRWRLGGRDDAPEGLTSGWRAQLLIEPLDALFSGQTAVALRRSGRNLRLVLQQRDGQAPPTTVERPGGG